MNETLFLRNKILETTIVNSLLEESEKGSILFSTINSVLSTCDCYFSSQSLVDTLGVPFTIKNGLCYAINYESGDLLFRLVISKKYLNNDFLYANLFKKYNVQSKKDKAVLYEERIGKASLNDENIPRLIGIFLNTSFKVFENKLLNVLDAFSKEYHEGTPITAELTKYERNREARIACIQYHGAKCAVCGFDFGKVYGKEFDGMIEVHHKLPLSEIKEDYIVDPINDLIPVCPNCHSAIHSKKDGFYTIEELKALLNK